MNYNKFKTYLKIHLASHSEECEDTKAIKLCAVIKRTYKNAEFSIESVKRASHSPRWNSDYTRDHRRRKAAWKQLLHNQCPKNWSDTNFTLVYLNAQLLRQKKNMRGITTISCQNPKNKKARFRYMRYRKILPSTINIDYANLSSDEITRSLELIAKGLESIFTLSMSANLQNPATT